MDGTGLSIQTLATLRDVLQTCPAVTHAILYGSRAMGTYRPGSDIDLTLEGAQLSEFDLLRIAGALQDSDIPYQVDLSLLHQIDNPKLLDHIKRVGKVLYPLAGIDKWRDQQ